MCIRDRDKYETWLRDYVENGKLDGVDHHDPAEWKSHVIGQCKSWLDGGLQPVSYTHLRAHETVLDIVCRLLLETKKQHKTKKKKKKELKR